MPKSIGPKYPGRLGKRIPAQGWPAPGPEDDTKLYFELLDLLFDHFHIDRPARDPVFAFRSDLRAWKNLALELAHAHVPCFQTRAKRGAPKRWGYFQEAKLYVDVMIMVREKKLSVSSVCQNLARLEPWRSFVKSKGGKQKSIGETLRTRFENIEKRGHPVLGLISRAEKNLPGRVDELLHHASKKWSW